MRIGVLAGTMLVAVCASAQVNGYARISSYSGSTLTVAESNETWATFDEGDFIVLMQMQDDVLGSTANDATFGSLSSIQRAGLYEIVRVSTLTRSGGALATLVLTEPPSISFNTNANARLQAITYERLGAGGDFTTTTNITAMNWNGNIGGVVAVWVPGKLRLAHSISADGAGFRGAAADSDNNTFGSCDGTNFVAASTSGQFGLKGEGIYRLTNTAWAKSKGRLLNGGGGGNAHNGGGGGGGNFTAGGLAGAGWSSVAPCHAGGLGGLSLGGHIAATRVFMGGGGGGGEANNSVSTAGSNGGGIVLVKADSIITLGACAGVRISANANNATQSGNDGAGGGGAGGSVIVQANGIRASSGCAIGFQANGGNGGRVNSSTHAGGGGGGQGVVIFNGPQPTGNTTVSTVNGLGGCNNNSVPCNSFADNGTGTNGSGILVNGTGPLPVELVSFQAFPVRDAVDLMWTTASEQNSSHFVVERSPDGHHWTAVENVPSVGFSYTLMNYFAKDPAPHAGTSYYRLVQVDLDGSKALSEHVPVHFKTADEGLVAWPNPANAIITVRHNASWERPSVRVYDSMGRSMPVAVLYGSGQVSFPVGAIPSGTYTVEIATPRDRARTQVVVQH
jgi:hypothetical protein